LLNFLVIIFEIVIASVVLIFEWSHNILIVPEEFGHIQSEVVWLAFVKFIAFPEWGEGAAAYLRRIIPNQLGISILVLICPVVLIELALRGQVVVQVGWLWSPVVSAWADRSAHIFISHVLTKLVHLLSSLHHLKNMLISNISQISWWILAQVLDRRIVCLSET
jgi:hypothetical protein